MSRSPGPFIQLYLGFAHTLLAAPNPSGASVLAAAFHIERALSYVLLETLMEYRVKQTINVWVIQASTIKQVFDLTACPRIAELWQLSEDQEPPTWLVQFLALLNATRQMQFNPAITGGFFQSDLVAPPKAPSTSPAPQMIASSNTVATATIIASPPLYSLPFILANAAEVQNILNSVLQQLQAFLLRHQEQKIEF